MQVHTGINTFRHQNMISRKDLDQVRQFAQNLRALVIGDVMLDKYIYGSVDRISPEAPVPIVNLHHTETKAGGEANGVKPRLPWFSPW